MGFSVDVRGDNIPGALRRLRKLLDRNGQARDLQRHRFHQTKNQRRRERDHKAARRRARAT